MAQVIPADDDFAPDGTNSSILGPVVGGYFNYEMDYNAGGDTTIPGWLFDGYAEDVTVEGGGLAVCTTPDPSFGDPPDSALFVRREVFQENQSSKATFSYFNRTGVYLSNTWGTNGVAVRVQDSSGGVSTPGLYDETLSYRAKADWSGYVFYAYATGVQSITFVLSRINAGVETVLSTLTPAFNVYEGELRTAILELVAITSGGTVALGGQYNGAVVVVALDSSGSRITGDGRCGVLIRGEKSAVTGEGSGDHRTGISTFEVLDQDAVGNPALFRDEFYRSSSMGRVVSDRAGVQGRLLTCDYSFDIYSEGYWNIEPQNGDDRSSLQWNVGPPDYVSVEGEASGNSAFVWAHKSRPVDSTRNQHRELKITHLGDYGGTCGIVLRGSLQATSFTNTPRGYRADCYVSSVPQLFVRLYRLDPGQQGNAVQLAEDNSITTIDLGDEYTLEFEVHEFDGPDPDAGAVMQVKINGVLVTWNNVQIDDDAVEFLSDGTVIDYSGQRWVSGNLEGINATQSPDTPQRDVKFRDFNQLALFTSSGNFNFDSHIDLAVPGEDDGATGTLTLDVTWPCEPWEIARTTRDEMVSGKTRRLALSEHHRGSWAVTAAPLDSDAALALIQFWNEHNGSEIPFTWTPPGDYSVAGTYKFRGDQITRVQLSPGQWGFQLILDPVETNP